MFISVPIIILIIYTYMPALYMNKEKEELRPVSHIHGIYANPVPSLPTKPKSICEEISRDQVKVVCHSRFAFPRIPVACMRFVLSYS